MTARSRHPRARSPPRTTGLAAGRRDEGPSNRGRSFGADRASRLAGALGRGARAPVERQPFEAEIAAPILTEFGEHDGQPDSWPPAGDAASLYREPPRPLRNCRPGDRHLLADDDPERNRSPTPRTCRRRGLRSGRGADEVLQGLRRGRRGPTSTIFWSRTTVWSAMPRCRTESIRFTSDSTELHRRGGGSLLEGLAWDARRSSPQRCARCSPFRRSTAGSCPTAPATGPSTSRLVQPAVERGSWPRAHAIDPSATMSD